MASTWGVMILGLGLGGCGGAAAPATTTGPSENVATADGSGAAAAADAGCDPTQSATWRACDGQRVTLEGEVAKMVHQHPILAVPAELTPDRADSEQGYVDVDGVQLIVLTAAPITCEGAVTVEGVLAAVSLGGDDGDDGGATKGSYGGWKVSGATVTCR
jgi:hypothetical protein